LTELALSDPDAPQARCRSPLPYAALRQAAGNFYVNDKPTRATVGQQPFGGARGSGTTDKAGSKMNLLRWTSARSIKETYNPPTSFPYPFMCEQ
jgi:1-pyrroline-5-carboxylate dehydrogenase